MNYKSSLFKEISSEEIQKIFLHSLGEARIEEAHLLKGGLFNTTYLVSYGEEKKKAVLRLGPVNRHLLMEFEENLMQAEEYVCSVCRKQEIPCSTILACDTSRKIIDRDFMIVEYIPSVVMSEAKKQEGKLSEEAEDYICRRTGEYLKKLHQVTGESFGYVSFVLKGQAFDSWGEALCYEADDILRRLEKTGGFTKDEAAAVRKVFYERKELLDEIKTPHLLHGDIWTTNILLNEDCTEIAALIDGDRASFGDIDFEFGGTWIQNPALKEAYGYEQTGPMTEKREERLWLYRLYYRILEAYVWMIEYNEMEFFRENKREALVAVKGGTTYE
ncbi:MAG: aminoglycoside phosphotransferase family protein [Clostridiales bacterium]|nr:aminoglycoside phosphotransferase family protein [Clostridiales bacterium]